MNRATAESRYATRVRTAFFIAAALSGSMACASFGAGSTGDPASSATDAGPPAPIDDGGARPAPAGDAAATDASDAATGCAAAHPGAQVCFDFDTHTPDPANREVSNATLSLEGVDAGGQALLATVDETLSGAETSHAYYHVGIDGSPMVVHWKFDLLLEQETLKDVDFMQLSAGGPAGGKCFIQPLLSGDNTFTIIESCGVPSPDRQVLSLSVEKSGWWNFDIIVDFTQGRVFVLLHDASGAASSGNGAFLSALPSSRMEIQQGIAFADSNAKGANYEFDNFYLYY